MALPWTEIFRGRPRLLRAIQAEFSAKVAVAYLASHPDECTIPEALVFMTEIPDHPFARWLRAVAPYELPNHMLAAFALQHTVHDAFKAFEYACLAFECERIMTRRYRRRWRCFNHHEKANDDPVGTVAPPTATTVETIENVNQNRRATRRHSRSRRRHQDDCHHAHDDTRAHVTPKTETMSCHNARRRDDPKTFIPHRRVC